MQNNGVSVTVDHRMLVLPPAKRAMNKKLNFLGASLLEAGNSLASINDQVLPRSEINTIAFHPVLQAVGSRENTDSLTFHQSMTGFTSHNTSIALDALF